MSRQFEIARQQTLEQLDQLFGHETAHLETWQQFAIAAEAFQMFAKTCVELANEMNTAPRAAQETGSVDMSEQPMGDPHPADLTRNGQCPVCGCTFGYHRWNCTLNQV